MFPSLATADATSDATSDDTTRDPPVRGTSDAADSGPLGRCAGRCGEWVDQAPCQCDADCLLFDDCCPDFAPQCAPGTCGDGQCDALETVDSCPADCDAAVEDAWSACLASSCAPALDACQSGACADAWTCVLACPPQVGCADGCQASLSSTDRDRLTALIDCAVSHQCFGGDKAILCGDGVCSAGEFAATCPADCTQQGFDSCAGRCGDFAVDAVCQCDPQCAAFDECCADYLTTCP